MIWICQDLFIYLFITVYLFEKWHWSLQSLHWRFNFGKHITAALYSFKCWTGKFYSLLIMSVDLDDQCRVCMKAVATFVYGIKFGIMFSWLMWWRCRQLIFVLLRLQSFSGTQNVSSLQKDEAWRVNVRIQGCDLDHGYLCGTMEALNVPMADTPVRALCILSNHSILVYFLMFICSSSQVVTFWEGEIVDTKNYTFFTGKWGAT